MSINGYYLLPNNTVETMHGVMQYYNYDLSKVNASGAYIPINTAMLREVMRDFTAIAGMENFTTEVFRRILRLPSAFGWLLALREAGFVDIVKTTDSRVVWEIVR